MAKRKKRRTHVREEDEAGKVPRSFVLASGSAGKSIRDLVRDFRKIMEPNTAVRLQEKSTNKLRDFVAVAGPLGVTHVVLFKQTDAGTNIRIGRMPRGPTVQFRIVNYTLSHDILAAQTKQRATGAEFKTPPLLVLNNFSENDNKLKLISTMIQNMFPPINIKEMKLSDTRRVVLFNYNKESTHVEVRHYLILAAPVGLSKSVKRLVQTNIPDLANYHDISEYILREDAMSESDNDDVDSRVELPQNYVGRGNTKNKQRAIRLVELGPRMELRPIKIQTGFCDGDVLFHDYIHKTAQEVKKLQEKRKKLEALKAQRRAEQEKNILKKKAEFELHQQKTGKRPRVEEEEEDEEDEEDKEDNDNDDDEDAEEDWQDD